MTSPLSFKYLLRLINGNVTETVIANGDQWMESGVDGAASCDLHDAISGTISCNIVFEAGDISDGSTIASGVTDLTIVSISTFQLVVEATTS